MAGTHGNAFVIENRADIVRMHAADDKRQDACLVAGGADQAQAADCAGLLGGVREQIVLVGDDIEFSRAIESRSDPR